MVNMYVTNIYWYIHYFCTDKFLLNILYITNWLWLINGCVKYMLIVMHPLIWLNIECGLIFRTVGADILNSNYLYIHTLDVHFLGVASVFMPFHRRTNANDLANKTLLHRVNNVFLWFVLRVRSFFEPY